MFNLDVNLWFARNQDNEIVSIINSNKDDEYICPICASKVIPKALESKKMSPHFAHIDVNKCNGEAMIHWWYKNKFIQKGDKFKIFTDKEIEFICKDFKTEVTYQLESGTYRPDLVVETECGQEIIFEMANTNKKMVKDYIDRWIELDKIIVEVDIKSLQNVDEIKKFNALYYNGKCFNFNKRDGGYYSTIGKLKEEMKNSGRYDIELVRKLDWFWEILSRYIKNEIEISEMFLCIDELLKSNLTKTLIINILKKKKCNTILDIYMNKLKENTSELIRRITNDSTFSAKVAIYTVFNEIYIKLDNYFNKIETTKYIECNEVNIKKLYNYYNLITPIIDELYLKLHAFHPNINVKQGYFNWIGEFVFNEDKEDIFTISIYTSKTTKHYEFDLSKEYINRIYPRYAEVEKLFTGKFNNEMMCNVILANFKSNQKLINNQCRDCKSIYNLPYDEFHYYISRNLHLPKRCKSCRNKRKKERLND